MAAPNVKQSFPHSKYGFPMIGKKLEQAVLRDILKMRSYEGVGGNELTGHNMKPYELQFDF